MAFSALFPGRIGMTYGVAVSATYAFLSVAACQRFDRTSAADWHNLGLRIVTMVAAVALSYLLVRVERQRRLRAVAAEAQRQGEVFALKERARETARAADDEGKRLVRASGSVRSCASRSRPCSRRAATLRPERSDAGRRPPRRARCPPGG